MQKTGIIFFPAFDWSLGESHPEREERLLYTQEQILEEGILDLPQIKQYAPQIALLSEILKTQAIFPNLRHHDLVAHRIAVGCSLVLGQALMKKEIKNGFVLVRPPGHHSNATVWGNRGFCTLNNEAILVNYLRSTFGIKKVAIIDTDVHHGDGTQDVFYYDPQVLCVSIHQDGRTLYPGTGFCEEKGGPNSLNSVLNVPLPPGVGDEGFIYTLENWILPVVEKFKPEIIINSAGQDNHFTDPLASMNVTAAGYGKITELVNPDLAVLEGGYSIQGALPYVNLAILLALAKEDYSGVIEPQTPPQSRIKASDFRSYLHRLRERYQTYTPEWTYRKQPQMPAGDWVFRDRNIYYDTDGIREHRQDYIRQCQNCGGTVLILTENLNLGEQGIVIRIPFDACKPCEQAGYDLLENYLKELKGRDRGKNILFQNQLHNRLRLWENGEEVKDFESEN
ncbi:MAG: histone deacetylase [Desulfitobacteriia bacterium]|jgi:acetoin utilization deacetylase AcuC-like enzyme